MVTFCFSISLRMQDTLEGMGLSCETERMMFSTLMDGMVISLIKGLMNQIGQAYKQSMSKCHCLLKHP